MGGGGKGVSAAFRLGLWLNRGLRTGCLFRLVFGAYEVAQESTHLTGPMITIKDECNRSCKV